VTLPPTRISARVSVTAQMLLNVTLITVGERPFSAAKSGRDR
jgi:hypothetical protein